MQPLRYQCDTSIGGFGPLGDQFSARFQLIVGGAEGDRTPDLCNAIAALSQLSYGPTRLPPGWSGGLERRPLAGRRV